MYALVNFLVLVLAAVVAGWVVREFLCWFFKINQILRVLEALRDPSKAAVVPEKKLPATRLLLSKLWQKVRPTSSKKQGATSGTATPTGSARSEIQP
jgi:hypothetical protein